MNLNNTYSFEIDFLPVGQASRSGDAIAMRYGYPTDFRVVVIDGGDQAAGEALAQHVRQVYGADHVDLAINTHPDADHASGLSVLVESIPVTRLWMHKPWDHPEGHHLFRSLSSTTRGLSNKIRDAVDAANKLYETAVVKGVRVIEEPFQGKEFGPLIVLSPEESLYVSLIPQFENTPPAKHPSPVSGLALSASESGIGLVAQSALTIQRGLFGLGQGAGGLLGALEPARQLGAGLIGSAMSQAGIGLANVHTRSRYETWTQELLDSDLETTAQNETSAVIYGRFNGHSVLLTADAGRSALRESWIYANALGIDLQRCSYYQMPHHGGRHNVSPDVLDLLLGPRSVTPIPPTRYAIASVAACADDYPRKSVVNAFKRRGVSVCRTAGKMITIQAGDFPNRMGSPAPQLPFYDFVDDADD